MKLFKVDVWIKGAEFKTHITVAKSNKLAIDRVLNVIDEDEIIGITASEIIHIDGYKVELRPI